MSKRSLGWIRDPGMVKELQASGVTGVELVQELKLRGWNEDRIRAAGVSLAAAGADTPEGVQKLRLLRDSAGRPIVIRS